MNTDLRVLHIITGLQTGGAEIMLRKLLVARGIVSADQVVSLGELGPVGLELRKLGFSVTALEIADVKNLLKAPKRLFETARSFRPDVICGWMYHGNLVALIAATAMRVPCVWGIRQTLRTYSQEKVLTRAVIWIGARLSSRSQSVMYNSRESVMQHSRIGYCSTNTEVVPNGFDLSRFRPNEGARRQVRAALGIDANAFVVGQIARRHPVKNHLSLIRSVGLARASGNQIHLLMAGRGVTWDDEEIRKTIETAGIANSVTLLGERNDTPNILAACDLLCSPSLVEGFPNAVGEAMACGVPCLVSDVGESAFVVGDTGESYPPESDELLTQAIIRWSKKSAEERSYLGRRARERIDQHFEISQVADTIYCRLARIVETV